MKIEQLTKDQLYAEFLAASDAYNALIEKYPFPLYKQHSQYPIVKQRLIVLQEEVMRRKGKPSLSSTQTTYPSL